jgi:WXXGXW repeat (2 copies)
MRNSILIRGLLIAACLPLITGCVERQVVYRDRPVYAAPDGEVIVNQPVNPPPLQAEVVPASPDPTFIWIAGNWEWRGRWVWISGRWAPPPRPDAVWVRGRWVRRHHRYIWVSGHWR